jgi:hypothetical protein
MGPPPLPPVPPLVVALEEATDVVVTEAPPVPPPVPEALAEELPPPADEVDVDVVPGTVSPPQPATADAAPKAVTAARRPRCWRTRRWPRDPLIPSSLMSILLRDEAMKLSPGE